MSRAIGDIIANSVGVSCIPEVKIMNIEDNFEHFLICSDGVWEFINCKTATNIICSDQNIYKGCLDLAKESWKRWL